MAQGYERLLRYTKLLFKLLNLSVERVWLQFFVHLKINRFRCAFLFQAPSSN